MTISNDNQPENIQFMIAIRCVNCGQTGNSVWEQNRIFARKRVQTVLITLTDGFYERIARKKPHPIELVCHRCETVQMNHAH